MNEDEYRRRHIEKLSEIRQELWWISLFLMLIAIIIATKL